MAAVDDAQRRFANRDAERLLTAALATAEKDGDAGTISRVSLRRGQVREELADYAGARDDHHRALSLARELGDPRMEAMALERLGWTAYYGRDADTAGDLAAQATALAEQAAAAPGALPSALVLVGRVRHWAGDMTGAASAYSDALVGAEPSTVASALSCLGALLEHGDRFEEANEVLARAIAQCEETGSFRALLRTLFFAGLARANLGDLVGALRVLERKRGLLERYDVHFYRARTSTTLSWVWRELGDQGHAEELAQVAIEQSREVTAGQLQTEQELHALLALAECRLLADDPGAAADLVAEAEPLLRHWLPFRWRAELRLVEVASRLEPERAELLLDLSRQRGSAKYQALALGRLGHREEAAKMAETTGSALLLAEGRAGSPGPRRHPGHRRRRPPRPAGTLHTTGKADSPVTSLIGGLPAVWCVDSAPETPKSRRGGALRVHRTGRRDSRRARVRAARLSVAVPDVLARSAVRGGGPDRGYSSLNVSSRWS